MLTLLLLACTPDAPDRPKAVDSGTPSSTDSGTGSGSTGTSAAVLTPTLLAGDPGTVVVVSWETDEPATSVVEFGTSDAYGKRTPGGAALTTHHAVMVVGLPYGSDGHLRARSETSSGEVLLSEDLVYTTPPIGEDAPAFVVVSDEPTSITGVLVLSLGGAHDGVAILDEDGALIWWKALPEGFGGEQVWPDPGGLHLSYNMAMDVLADSPETRITRVRLDGAEVQDTPTPFGHHDYLLRDDGGYEVVRADARAVHADSDGVLDLVVGDDLAIVDASGAVVDVPWSAWDHIPFEGAEESPFYGTGALDWTHFNGVYGTEDAWYLSSHGLSTIYKVDRATGQVVWQIGDDRSDFRFAPGTRAFHRQHSPRWVNGHLLVFDNTDGDDLPPRSFVTEYALDEATGVATLVREYTRDIATYSSILGCVDVLPDDSWLVAWGTDGLIEEVTTDGVAVRAISAPAYRINNVHVAPPLGGPLPE